MESDPLDAARDVKPATPLTSDARQRILKSLPLRDSSDADDAMEKSVFILWLFADLYENWKADSRGQRKQIITELREVALATSMLREKIAAMGQRARALTDHRVVLESGKEEKLLFAGPDGLNRREILDLLYETSEIVEGWCSDRSANNRGLRWTAVE